MMDKIKSNLIEIFASMFFLLFIFWAIGYFFNAFSIWGAKFELESCWGGFAALSGSGTLAAVKYIYDSIYNSNKGEKP